MEPSVGTPPDATPDLAAGDRPQVSFETHPSRYRHWRLSVEAAVATLAMDVREDGGLDPGYRLKLNSYDLAVDIELADALQRIRFEHPAVRVVVVRSAKERVFCAGANIFMLAAASHAFKVNFCKFTNETRLAMEQASAQSGIRFVCAINGICAGGGYELALACDEILLVDDGNASVSLPETPLLGVLPGTGGLTRLVDKRHVRRDLADVFCTLVEGVKGKRAVQWGLVDAVHPSSRFAEALGRRVEHGSQASPDRPGRPADGRPCLLSALEPRVSAGGLEYRFVQVAIDRGRRVGTLTVQGPPEPTQATPTPDNIAMLEDAGDAFWALRAFRELDDALLRVRVSEPEIGTILVRTVGDLARVVAVDRFLAAHRDHWLVREIVLLMARVLKRMDQTARSFIAIIEPGSCFGGSLFELALAADRSYMLDDPQRPTAIALSPLNAGLLPMGNGLSRLATRLLGEPEVVADLAAEDEPFDPMAAMDAGLVTVAPDELDWDDEVRLAVEARAAFSPDALTAMEASLRFAGPETLETKIFGRLSAWQNWVFQRPNAVGERGALKAFGGAKGRPEFDWTRT
jgi:benzoyl-CoA-dihydrodiol lyase